MITFKSPRVELIELEKGTAVSSVLYHSHKLYTWRKQSIPKWSKLIWGRYLGIWSVHVTVLLEFGNHFHAIQRILLFASIDLFLNSTSIMVAFSFELQEILGSFNSSLFFNYTNYRNLFPIWALGEFHRRLLAKRA